MRAATMGAVHGNQPLNSIEAFALALVEASSRLDGNLVKSPIEISPHLGSLDEDLPAAAE